MSSAASFAGSDKCQLPTTFVLKFDASKNCLRLHLATSVDSDQMLHCPASDLGLHCLLRPICMNVFIDDYSILYIMVTVLKFPTPNCLTK